MLQTLMTAGIEPDVLVGGSVGAINACFLGSHPGLEGVEALAAKWRGMTEEALCGHRRGVVVNVARRRPYLFSADRFRRMVAEWIPTYHLENLRIPVRVATTDLLTGRSVHHEHGYIPDLLAASAALPGLFPPVVLRGATGPATHIDAGISENVPLTGTLAVAEPGDTVWVLDVTRTPQSSRALRSPLDVLIASLVASVRNRDEPPVPSGVTVRRIKLDEAFDCGGVFDFTHTEDLIRLGAEAARAVLSTPAPTPAPTHLRAA